MTYFYLNTSWNGDSQMSAHDERLDELDQEIVQLKADAIQSVLGLTNQEIKDAKSKKKGPTRDERNRAVKKKKPTAKVKARRKVKRSGTA
jgi:hypothetical protein